VRENMRGMRRDNLAQIVNVAVNQTLGRTVITAGTTLLSVIALYLFGGEVLEGFAFTMLVGIISGTYSTVFIAASIAIMLQGRKPLKGQVVVSTPAPVAPPPATPAAEPAPAASVPAADGAAAMEPVPVPPLLKLRFTGTSWAEVKDAEGKVLHSQHNTAGTEFVVEGTPPF
jgi:hypothetical protein